MSLRTITISDADLAALVAIRPVIADAHLHPGRAAAIAALDRLAEAPEILAEEPALPAAEYEMLGSSEPARAPLRLTREAGATQRTTEELFRTRVAPSPQQRAQLCGLLGFERLEVLREDREGRYRVSALSNGGFASEHVTDDELARCAGRGAIATAWVDAFGALACQLDVPNAEARLRDVALLLATQLRPATP